MSWFWLNIPLGTLFFLATAGIPLWMVLRHPDTRSPATRKAAAAVPDATPLSQPVVVPMPSGTLLRRELAGASAGRAYSA